MRKLPAVYREVGASYRGGNPDGTKRWMDIDAHARQPGATEQPLRTPTKLEVIATPMLAIAADADLLAPPGLMRLWIQHVKDHEWAIVPDAGHAIAWEQPDAFNEKVLAFLGRH